MRSGGNGRSSEGRQGSDSAVFEAGWKAAGPSGGGYKARREGPGSVVAGWGWGKTQVPSGSNAGWSRESRAPLGCLSELWVSLTGPGKAWQGGVWDWSGSSFALVHAERWSAVEGRWRACTGH